MCQHPQMQAQQSNRTPAMKHPLEESCYNHSTPTRKRVRFSDDLAESHQDTSQQTRAVSTPQREEAMAPVISPEETRKVMVRVQLRAQRRRRTMRRSKSPPRITTIDDDSASLSTVATTESSSSSSSSNGIKHLHRQLELIEKAIKEAALKELELMNRAKKLRSKRALMTEKYQCKAKELRERQVQQQSSSSSSSSSPQDGNAIVFQTARLPPLMSLPSLG